MAYVYGGVPLAQPELALWVSELMNPKKRWSTLNGIERIAASNSARQMIANQHLPDILLGRLVREKRYLVVRECPIKKHKLSRTRIASRI